MRNVNAKLNVRFYEIDKDINYCYTKLQPWKKNLRQSVVFM